MKILDKYVIKNFLVGYLIAFFVLIGLRIIIDLFVNLDEFAKHSNLGMLASSPISPDITACTRHYISAILRE